MEEKNNNGINVVAVRKKILDEEKRMKYDNNLIKQKARMEKAAKKREEEIQKVKVRAQVFNNKVQAIAEKRKSKMEEKKNQSPEKTEYKFPSYEEFRTSACCQKYRKIDLDMDKIQSKIQVSGMLNISSSNPSMKTSLFQKFYNGNVRALMLKRQHVSFNQLVFFSQNLVHLFLIECTVLFENGNEVPCEAIVANCPELQSFSYVVRPNFVADYSNMARELLKIRHFRNMCLFSYAGLSESFDIDLFLPYLMENKRTNVFIRYNDPLSDDYKEKLQIIVDEIVDADAPRQYLTPLILFNGQTRVRELYKLWFKPVIV
uniref:Uncharacterized protein n=1 Tax=Panagrolaimus sp. ES5 TaxID=591445 RepID=A0AC34GT98_9BILA